MSKPKRKELHLSLVLVYSLLLNTGVAFMFPLTTMYMHNYLHESLTVAGLVLFAMSVATMVGNYVGGYLFDRWSPYKTAIISVCITLFADVVLIFFHGWPIFGIMLLIYGFGDGASLTLLNSYASLITSKSTRYVFNALYVGINLGVVVGTALVGFLFQYGVWVVFTVASFVYIVLLIITIFDFNIELPKPEVHRINHPQKGYTNPLIKKDSIALIWKICFMIFCIYLGYTLWDSVMSVRMTQLGNSFQEYSILWTINGLLIVFIQPIISKIGLKFKMSNQIAFGVIIFALTFFMLIFARKYLSFVIIMVILTFGEMNGLPSLPAWIDKLSDPRQKGKFQGMFNIFMALGRAVGPLAGGLIIEYANYNTLWIGAGILILIALAFVMLGQHKMTKDFNETTDLNK